MEAGCVNEVLIRFAHRSLLRMVIALPRRDPKSETTREHTTDVLLHVAHTSGVRKGRNLAPGNPRSASRLRTFAVELSTWFREKLFTGGCSSNTWERRRPAGKWKFTKPARTPAVPGKGIKFSCARESGRYDERRCQMTFISCSTQPYNICSDSRRRAFVSFR